MAKALGAMAVVLPPLGGDIQSSFAAASPAARDVLVLTFVMSLGAGVILLIVLGLIALAIFARHERRARLAAEPLILIAGLAIPAVVLAVLLTFGLILPGPIPGHHVPADWAAASAGTP